MFVYKLIHMVFRRKGCFKFNGKYDWKMIRHICIDYCTFNVIVKNGIDDAIYLVAV